MIEIFKIGFLSISLFDLIDIGIVTVIFYWVYKALKDTVAVQVFFGLFIIIVFSFLTETLQLKSINWLLRTISDIWLLAFIILFHPEIRRLMLMITRSPLFKLFVKSKMAQTIDEIIDAVLEMSEKHIGALIVFTRTKNIEMTIDTGITLHANVSKELLLSIFNTKSPLHDGAVIIQNQVAVAARCVLPLTSKTRYDGKNLGTRHRAALGLSEQVDTVVLIVSEETGAVSLAEGGEMTLDIRREHIAGILNSRLTNN